MDDNQQPDKRKQEDQSTPASIGELRRIATAIEAHAKATQQEPKHGGDPTKPLFVQQIGGDDLEPFEEQTLAISRQALGISRRTYFVGIFGFLAALAAAIFVGSQVRIMTYQTQIMAAQAESEAAGGSLAAIQVQKQLDAAQQQAKAAQESVRAIQDQLSLSKKQWRDEQRPWISLQNVRPTKGKSVPDADVPNNWYATYDVINTGHSPATRVEIWGFITVAKSINSTFRGDAPCGESDMRSNDFRFAGLTVFAGQPAVNRDHVFSFRPGDTPTWELGGNALVVCISYRDGTTHELHHTKMLFSAQEGAYYFDDKGRRVKRVAGFVPEDADTD